MTDPKTPGAQPPVDDISDFDLCADRNSTRWRVVLDGDQKLWTPVESTEGVPARLTFLDLVTGFGPLTPLAQREQSMDRAAVVAQSVREFLRRSATSRYMLRKEPVDFAAYLQADAFNYIHGMSRADGVTLQDLVQALAAANDEIEKLTGRDR